MSRQPAPEQVPKPVRAATLEEIQAHYPDFKYDNYYNIDAAAWDQAEHLLKPEADGVKLSRKDSENTSDYNSFIKLNGSVYAISGKRGADVSSEFASGAEKKVKLLVDRHKNFYVYLAPNKPNNLAHLNTLIKYEIAGYSKEAGKSDTFSPRQAKNGSKNVKYFKRVSLQAFMGVDLFHVVDKELLSEHILDICLSAAKQLKAEFHDKDLIHRDIKLENIMVRMTDDPSDFELKIIDRDDIVKLQPQKPIDLGNGQAPIPQQPIFTEQTVMPVGTPAYLPPEVERILEAKRDKTTKSIRRDLSTYTYNKAGDIYCLGEAFKELATHKNITATVKTDLRVLVSAMNCQEQSERIKIDDVIGRLKDIMTRNPTVAAAVHDAGLSARVPSAVNPSVSATPTPKASGNFEVSAATAQTPKASTSWFPSISRFFQWIGSFFASKPAAASASVVTTSGATDIRFRSESTSSTTSDDSGCFDDSEWDAMLGGGLIAVSPEPTPEPSPVPSRRASETSVDYNWTAGVFCSHCSDDEGIEDEAAATPAPAVA